MERVSRMEKISGVVEVQKEGVIVLRISGKLDSKISPEIEKKVFQYLNSGYKKILFDLSNVSYVNSAGLRMLLSVKKQTKSSEGKLIVCALKNEVLEIMKICGFDHVLEIVPTEEEALQQF